jgi:hypothetical protein
MSLDRLAAALCEAWEQAVPATSGHLSVEKIAPSTTVFKVQPSS